MTIQYCYLYDKNKDKFRKTPTIQITDADFLKAVHVDSPRYAKKVNGKIQAESPIITLTVIPDKIVIDEDAWDELTKRIQEEEIND